MSATATNAEIQGWVLEIRRGFLPIKKALDMETTDMISRDISERLDKHLDWLEPKVASSQAFRQHFNLPLHLKEIVKAAARVPRLAVIRAQALLRVINSTPPRVLVREAIQPHAVTGSRAKSYFCRQESLRQKRGRPVRPQAGVRRQNWVTRHGHQTGYYRA